MKTYPIAEGERVDGIMIPRLRFLAVATGEKRPPKAGEWFLSGAIVEAYKATNDLTSSAPIATIHKRLRRVIITAGERVDL